MSSLSEGRHRTVHQLQTTPRPTRKPLGELAELAFMSKAASLGFGVAKPYGDSERFDFILSWDHRLWRVQVKSPRTARVYEIGAHACWGGVDTYTYTKNEIDLIVAYVAYVVPEDTWYVFPIEATRGGQAPLSPSQRPPQRMLQIRKIPRSLVANEVNR
jgi:hypothetical protein